MRVESHKDMLPIKMWLEAVEPSAMQQLYHLAQLPFAYKWIAVMPDCHTGYGMPIGGVMATNGVVIPNAVGVDIGCGMCAVKTTLLAEEWAEKENVWKYVLARIREAIPMGRNHHKEMVPISAMTPPGGKGSDEVYLKVKDPVLAREWDSSRYQMGTLGGGNHFIEIQKGSDGFIWIMLHSGSRNVGYKVAQHYNKLAVTLNQKWQSQVPKHWQLAFLPLDSQEGQDYLIEMQWSVEFALANRYHMMNAITEIIKKAVPVAGFFDPINIAHNYAAMEHHYGQNVMVHRKGATRARSGELGVIPGSMGTKSYIVEGLGNPESFDSCSHGAGRLMSRTAAKEQLDLADEQAKMDAKGIIHGVRHRSDLDEAPGAYKEIDTVMENQKDLVRPLVELEPIAVAKG